MDVLVSLIISLLLLVAGAGGSSSTNAKTAAEYWRSLLPETAIPQAILDQLTPHEDDMSLSSNNLKFSKGPRKIGYEGVKSEANRGDKHVYHTPHAQVGLKEVSVSYGSQGEEYAKGTIAHKKKIRKDMRRPSILVDSQGKQELEEIFSSRKPQLGGNLKEVSISYELQGETNIKKVPLNLKRMFATYKSQKEENLKEVSVSYGSVGGENLKEVSISYGLEGGKDLKEASVSYGAEGGEDLKEVSVSYGLEWGKDLKEVSVSYGVEGGEDLKEVSVSYGLESEKDLKEVSVSYGVEGGDAVKEVSMSYGVEGGDNLKEVSMSYGTSQENNLKEVSVSYGSEQEGKLKEVSVSYGSDEDKYRHNEVLNRVEEDPNKATMVYGSEDGDDPNRATVSYGSEHEDDPQKLTMSGRDSKTVSTGHGTHTDGEGSHHHHVHDHAHNSHNSKRQQADVFFFHDMLRPGSIITPTIPPTTSLPAFLPRDVANSIPFSTKRLSEIISTFAPASLAMARDIRWTLDTCENPRTLPGQKAGCATSLESLAELPVALLGTRNVRALSAADLPVEAPGTAALRGRYNVTAARRVSGGDDSEEVVTCHDLTYPYAVYYCHTANPTAAYTVTLESMEDGAAPATMEVLAVCHLDTSRWSPKNPFLELHSLKPGDVAVCHFLTKLSIIWVRAGELAQGDAHAMAM